MDIDLLSKMLKELILDKDEVSLPGIGSFVAELVPSTFSDKGYTINPPYRRLYFRQKKNDGDTSLADLYAESNNIDRAAALQVLTDFLSEMKVVLLQKKTIIFPGLGRLRATRENNFFFVADEDLDIYPAGFGLEPVSLKTHQETEEEVAEALSNLKSIIASPPTEADCHSERSEESAAKEADCHSEQSEESAQTRTQILTPAAQAQDDNEAAQVQDDNEAAQVQNDSATTQVTDEADCHSERSEESAAQEEDCHSEQSEESAQTRTQILTPAAQAKDDNEAAQVQNDSATTQVQDDNETAQATDERNKRSAGRTLLRILMWTAIIAVTALIIFIVISHLFPEFIDTILYNQEEREILFYSDSLSDF